MYVVRQLKWNEVHDKWDTFKLGAIYQQYLQETYGITVTAGRTIWNHVIEVSIVIQPALGGAGDVYGGIPGKKKKKCKEIKLIFIMNGTRTEQIKCNEKLVSLKMIADIQNQIEQQLETKIVLRDVQIIKG